MSLKINNRKKEIDYFYLIILIVTTKMRNIYFND